MKHVMPFFGKGERLTRREAEQRIGQWLGSLAAMPTVLGDTDYYTILLSELLHECGIGRERLHIEQLAFASKVQAHAFETAIF